MSPETSTATPTIIEQVRTLPLPAALYGRNVTAEVDKAVAGLRSIPTVTDEADKSRAEAAIKEGQKIIKIAGDKRLSVTRIFDEAKKLFMQAEAGLLAELTPELQVALNTVNTYNREQLSRQRKAEQAVRDAREAELNRKRAPESIARVQGVIEAEVAAAQAEHKTAGVSTVWKYEVTDAALVPRQYCAPDAAAIAAAVKAGARHIAGVNIYEDAKRTGR